MSGLRYVTAIAMVALLAAACGGQAPEAPAAPPPTAAAAPAEAAGAVAAPSAAPAPAPLATPTPAERFYSAMNTLTEGSARSMTIETPSVNEEGAAVSPPVATSTAVLQMPSPALDVGTPFTPPEWPSTDTPLHDIPIALLDGETLRLSDLRGKVVVLNFWASWCPPCRWEMPAFEAIWREYRDQGVVFVGIGEGDTVKDARGFAEDKGITYPLGLDTTAQFARQLSVLQLPTTFLFDREGNQTRKIVNVANEGVLKVFLAGLLRTE